MARIQRASAFRGCLILKAKTWQKKQKNRRAGTLPIELANSFVRSHKSLLSSFIIDPKYEV